MTKKLREGIIEICSALKEGGSVGISTSVLEQDFGGRIDRLSAALTWIGKFSLKHLADKDCI